MHNVWLLVKNYIRCGAGSLRGKNEKTKGAIGIIVIVLIYAAIFAGLTYLQMSTAKMMEAESLGESVLALGYLMALLISIIFAFQKITGGQKANDAELLLAMPLKKGEILVAKALSRYLFNFVVTFMFLGPSILAYTIYAPFTIVALCGNILVLLLIPLFAVALSYIIDFLVTFCLPASKIGSVFKAVFTLVLLVAYLFVYEYGIMNIDKLHLGTWVNYILTFNPIFILVLLAVVIGVFAFGIWLFSLCLMHEGRATKTKAVTFKKKSQTVFGALLKNEVNRYLDSPVLMVNTFIGPIGVVATTIWALVDKTTFPVVAALIGLPVEYAYIVIALAYGGFVIFTYPSAFAISLEGKQFWILQSMPVKTNLVLLAKALFNILLISPFCLIGGLILSMALKLKAIVVVVLILLPIFMNIIVSFGGVLVNLLFPKFEFESESSVVKNSMSSLLMMLVGGILIALVGVMMFMLLRAGWTVGALCALILGVVAAIATVCVILLFTLGKRIFQRL